MSHRFFAIVLLFLFALCVDAGYVSPMRNPITNADRTLAAKAAEAASGVVEIPEGAWLLVVSASMQKMVASLDGEVKAVYTISTAKAGLGQRDGSGKTPLGWHKVTEWIGEGAMHGQVFVSRRPNDEILHYSQWSQPNSEDKVVSRIMWLSGLEPGFNQGGNVDSHSRYIYLHGTNQEHLLGTPASHGCIRMYNRDVIELFSKTKDKPTFCLITE